MKPYINEATYKLALEMEDERIRLGGRLVFLFLNQYIVDSTFQDKVQSLSEPIEIDAYFEYTDGYSKAESESGSEVTVDAVVTISKLVIDKTDGKLREGDYISLSNKLRLENYDDEENYDDYDSFTILAIRPVVMEGQYLNRVISYSCDLQMLGSRDIDDDL